MNEELKRLHDRQDWKGYVTRESTPLYRYLGDLSLRQTYFSNSETDLEFHETPWKTYNYTVFYSESTVEEWIQEVREKCRDPEYFFKASSQVYRECDRHLRECREIGIQKMDRKSREELVQLFKRFADSDARLGPVRIVGFALDHVLEEKLESVFGSAEKVQENIMPEKEPAFAEKRRRMLEIASRLPDNADLNRELLKNEGELESLEEIKKEYSWMGISRFKGEPLTIEDFMQELEEMVKDSPGKKLEQLRTQREEKEEDLEKLLEENSSREARKLVKIARRVAHLRTFRMDAFSKGQRLVRPLLEEIATRLGLSYSDLIYMDGREVVKALQKDEAAEMELIRRRKEEYATIRIDGEFQILSGEDVRLLRPEVSDRKSSQVEGRVAQSGSVSGKAKLVRTEEDLEKFEEGDIIVSPMTKPEMTPALEKAAGIVTDEGGMLCHAAVVSRELGIPCVIGTGEATKVFEDGDRIEIKEEGRVELRE